MLQRVGEQLAAFGTRALEPLRVVVTARDDLVKNGRVLPHVQRCQMKPECIYPAYQTADVIKSRVRAFVGLQAGSDEAHIVSELLCLFVTAGTAFECTTQSFANLRQKHTIGHAIVARRGDCTRPGEQCHVLLDTFSQLRARC